MTAKLLICLLVANLLCTEVSGTVSASAALWTSEDGRLVVRDETATMSAELFNHSVEKTRATM